LAIIAGCIFWSRSFSAFSSSFPASITAVVVPSPTSSSCVFNFISQSQISLPKSFIVYGLA
jgi:hypothetical protein